MNILKITIISLICIGLTAGCGGGGSAETNTSEDLSISYTIKDSSFNTTTDFTVGDDVIIEINLINNTVDSLTIFTTRPKIFVHEVYDSTGLAKLYDSSLGDPPGLGVGMALSPGQHSFGITWDCTDSYGNLLSAGSYILVSNGSYTQGGQKRTFSRTTQITLH